MRCGSGVPILLGDRARIKEAAAALNISLEGIRLINPAESEDLDNFARRFKLLRHYTGKRMKGLEAREAMLQPNYFGAMMLAMHQADGFVAGTRQITAQRAAAAVPDHQARPADQHRLQLPGDGGRRLALWREWRAVHGGLRRH